MDRIQDFEVNSPRWLSLEDFEGEIWKPVSCYEGWYMVSNLGRVKTQTHTISLKGRGGIMCQRTYKPHIMKLWDNGYGYLVVHLGGRKKKNVIYIHRLVANAFIPNPQNKEEIDHINTNKSDNRSLNLRWVTKSENMCNPITYERNKIAQGDPVVLLDCWGEYIGEYFSAQELADVLGVASSVVKDVMKNNRSARTVLGFTVLKKKDYDTKNDYSIMYKRGTSPYIYVPNAKMVLVFKQGELFTVFPNSQLAAEAYDAKVGQITRICRFSDGDCTYIPTYLTTDTLCYYKDVPEDVQQEALSLFKSKYPPKAYL